jgi:hypothetical protein
VEIWYIFLRIGILVPRKIVARKIVARKIVAQKIVAFINVAPPECRYGKMSPAQIMSPSVGQAGVDFDVKPAAFIFLCPWSRLIYFRPLFEVKIRVTSWVSRGRR